MSDYQKNITLHKPAGDVYAAVTAHIRDWWSNDFTGTSTRKGDSFTIAFGRTCKTMDIAEAIPCKLVIWKCVKAYIDLPTLENKGEWVGTKIIWTITVSGQETTVTFLHEGLNPGFECYHVCESGWDQFLASFQTYLETGKGMPFLKTRGKED